MNFGPLTPDVYLP